MENENLTDDEYFQLMNTISRLTQHVLHQEKTGQELWDELNQRCDDFEPTTFNNYRGE